MNKLTDRIQVLYLSIKYLISGSSWERSKQLAEDIVYGWDK